jgi:type IV secretion system protein VirB1
MLPGLEQLVVQCAPQVSPNTMMAIIRVESGGNPHAINVNGRSRLARQPRSRQEALAWSEWLIQRGYSIDMGLTQVNSANLPRLSLRLADMFEPCANIAAGASILSSGYADASRRFGQGQNALKAALSAYNTGNHKAGITNGYVAKVTAAAQPGGGNKPSTNPAPPLRKSASSNITAKPTSDPRSPGVFSVQRTASP